MAHVSIIGTGNMGQAIAGVVTKGGNTVELFGQADGDPPVTGDIVVLAVPYPAVADVLAKRADAACRQGRRRHHQPAELRDLRLADRPRRRLGRRRDRCRAARSRVLKAFNTNFAATLASGTVGALPTTVLIAGDDADAKAPLAGIVTAGGLRAIDAGALPGPASSRRSASCRSPSPPARRCPGRAASASRPDRSPLLNLFNLVRRERVGLRKVVCVGAENSVTPCDQWMHVYEAAEASCRCPCLAAGARCATLPDLGCARRGRCRRSSIRRGRAGRVGRRPEQNAEHSGCGCRSGLLPAPRDGLRCGNGPVLYALSRPCRAVAAQVSPVRHTEPDLARLQRRADHHGPRAARAARARRRTGAASRTARGASPRGGAELQQGAANEPEVDPAHDIGLVARELVERAVVQPDRRPVGGELRLEADVVQHAHDPFQRRSRLARPPRLDELGPEPLPSRHRRGLRLVRRPEVGREDGREEVVVALLRVGPVDGGVDV